MSYDIIEKDFTFTSVKDVLNQLKDLGKLHPQYDLFLKHVDEGFIIVGWKK